MNHIHSSPRDAVSIYLDITQNQCVLTYDYTAVITTGRATRAKQNTSPGIFMAAELHPLELIAIMETETIMLLNITN